MGNRCSVKIMRSDPRSWWSRHADGAPSSREDDGLVCVCVCVTETERGLEGRFTGPSRIAPPRESNADEKFSAGQHGFRSICCRGMTARVHWCRIQ